MTFVCIALVLLLGLQAYLNGREREKLLRRIQSPQQVIVEEASAKPRRKPEQIWTDAQYKRLNEERGSIPRDN